MTEVQGAINAIRVVSVAQQGPAGPPGPDGPGFASRMGNVYMLAPLVSTIPLVSASAYGFTIGGLSNLQVSSGTLTLSIQINGEDVTGLSNIEVSSSPQNLVATAANAVNAGDRLTLVISEINTPANLEFTMY